MIDIYLSGRPSSSPMAKLMDFWGTSLHDKNILIDLSRTYTCLHMQIPWNPNGICIQNANAALGALALEIVGKVERMDWSDMV